LVGVLAVAEGRGPLEALAGPHGERLSLGRGLPGDPGGHGDVVGAGVAERGGGEAAALLDREPAGRHGLQRRAVPGRVDEHGDRGMVLGGGPDHRGPADVDLLDAGVVVGARGDGVGEGIEIDDDELECRDAELLDLLHVLGLAGVGEDAGVDPRVQGLDPALEALGEAGDLVHGCDRDAGGGDPLGGRAGGDDRDPRVGQSPREVLEARLVVDADQRAAYGPAGGGVIRLRGHDWCTFRPSMWSRPLVAAVRTSASISRSATLMRSWRDPSVSSVRTSTARWAITGPVSTPASTRWTVQPLTATP